jgi:putative membrane protein
MSQRNLLGSAVAFAMAVTVVHAAQRGAAPAPTADARTFINDMAIAGMAEVQLGKLATQRAQSAEVKEFGQMMVKDHTQANAELARVAQEQKITLPTQLDQKHRDLVDRLSKLKGAEFDREYMRAMVPGHEEVAMKLRTKAGSQATPNTQGSQSVGTSGANSEQALVQWASKSLPTVQHHLERAKEIEQTSR